MHGETDETSWTKPMTTIGATPAPAGRAGGRTRLLLIDDDEQLCDLLRRYLESMGFAVDAAHTGPDGLDRALAGQYHAVILDVMLPGLDGFEVLKRLRSKSEVPILMLTARGDEPDRVVGLEIGADDYLPKTSSPRELLARVRAVLRRAARPPASTDEAPEPEIVVGPLRLNPATRLALLRDRPLRLTSLEFELLLVLARSPGRVRTREQLLNAMTDRDYDVFDRSIDMHISILRRKLGDDARAPRFIKTVWGVGYVLTNPETPAAA